LYKCIIQRRRSYSTVNYGDTLFFVLLPRA